jgi:hypothetical protein
MIRLPSLTARLPSLVGGNDEIRSGILLERIGVLDSKTRTVDDASPNVARAANKMFERPEDLSGDTTPVSWFSSGVYVVGVRRRIGSSA